MKKLPAILISLFSLTAIAQDTTCVMLTLDEVLIFDYSTSEVLNRFDHTGEYSIDVAEGEILCLHLYDDKKRFREVTTIWKDGDHVHDTFKSKDNVLYTNLSDESFIVEVSPPRKRKR
ncbi:MAG: hypothetical protein CL823_06335 [Crocinitomicaceae bacterium]|nr:hypothetical protein [Crocinitomicaceae bacterium]|tara:strand:+ start:1868 stop:2221 length:354 start_codon:yes stop_codon:yes gene_type:complete